MILLLWSPAEARAATNDFANPSFETAGAGAADAVNWTKGTNHARSNDRVHAGSWALKSSYTGTSTRSDPITVTPNTTDPACLEPRLAVRTGSRTDLYRQRQHQLPLN